MRSTTVLLVMALAFVATSQHAFSAGDTLDDEYDPFEIETAFSDQKPFILFSGGMTSFSMNSYNNFESDLTFGAVLGFQSNKKAFRSDIRHISAGGVYIDWVMPADSVLGSYTVESWRFGFESSDAYGYPIGAEGKQSVDFTSTRAPLSWFVPSFPSLGNDSSTSAKLDRYDGVAFGESARASIGVGLTQNISLQTSFEWAQAYERHMFWYWAGSGLIEGIADGLGTFFVKAVGKSSPTAAPIVHFLVRNGIAMGFKALRMNQMNWPFDTAPPLNFYNVNLGIKVTF